MSDKKILSLAEKLFVEKSSRLEYGNLDQIKAGAKALAENCLIYATEFYIAVEEHESKNTSNKKTDTK